ncbi:non-ribosomal peptide synthetase [Chitinophaga sp. GbtcB8]|uniref:non-ribosomal peptide synthetase n=1 Tax=Chitinophaga sp. GbtcB8 TaxID=2824753 RepID=UPI001C310E6F|nr:non-ribosomal peptide synthetase [Chitinophaga sp. GbtcB8]
MSQRNTEKSYTVPLLVSNAFDISLFETFLPLLSGGTAIMTSDEQMKDVDYLAEELQQVNAFHAVPALMSQLVNHISASGTKEKYAGITDLFIGGDAVPDNVLQEMKEVFPTADIHVLYGPTEATIFMSAALYPAGEKADLNGALIGKPLENRKIYILDKHEHLCPVGVTGEICIGGATLARGYLNQPELTAQKFVPDPFNAGAMMYKTGDLGRWLPDGSVTFAGRADNQVKIRGYRIELGEIESTLEKHEDIQSAIVLTHANAAGEKELVAYVVASGAPEVQELRAYLGQTLPHYMVPGYFVQLAALPLTPNGKIDRKALPAPEEMNMVTGAVYVAPRNETEEKLVAIWQQILGREPVGIRDNFFDLGGHSLKATRLASHIYREFGVKVALKDLFTHSVAEEQALLIKEAVQAGYEHIPAATPAASYPLSSAQRRLWVISQFEEGNIAYNMPAVYVFNGQLDYVALEAAFRLLLERHEVLRTVFRANETGDVQQIVLPANKVPLQITYRDARELSLASAALKALVQEEGRRPFDLSEGPLLRICLYQLSADQWVFINTMHHIISDGWSAGILIRELLQAYHAITGESVYDPAPLRIQYKDYAVWQQLQLKGNDPEGHRAYWQQQFSGDLPVLDMPGVPVRPAIKTFNGGAVLYHFPDSLSSRLRNLLHEEGSTLFMGLLAAVNTLLYRYSGQEDIIIGSPVAGREHADLDDQIGFYINMLALRSRFSGAENYRSILAGVKQTTLNGYAHQVYPFDELVSDLQLQRDVSRNALFDVLVALQNAEVNVKLPVLSNLQITPYSGEESTTSKYDLAFIFSESAAHIHLRLEYNSDIYDHDIATRLTRHLGQLCEAIVLNPDTAIQQLDYLTADEKQQLLVTFNDNTLPYPKHRSIVDLFEEQVQNTPDHTALVAGATRLSYRELNEQANRLANYLVQHYAPQADELIGLVMDRSEWLVIGILGVLKAGAAYVPVDPTYPRERKKFIIKDAGVKVILTTATELFEAEMPADVIDIRSAFSDNAGNLAGISISPNSLAYVIYTSGSTGTPKGVMIEHHSLVNFCYWNNYAYAVTAADRASMYASVSFDAAVWELFPYLIKGACVFVVPPDIRLDMEKLAAFYDANQVTISFLPTGIAERFLEVPQQQSLRYLQAGGDKLTTFTKRNYQLVNNYGPTETTIIAISYAVNEAVPNIPIGKPVSNTRVYILSRQLALCPVGVNGEICIGGEQVARGYAGHLELTAEKFIPDPFREGERLYRTGDIGRWQPDGNILFLGRMDEQLKIRGNRIEPGEIESALLQYGTIEAAVVLARQDSNGEKVLVAYLSGKEQPDTASLRAYLAPLLPAYMLPHHYIYLESLPLTANGKVDRKRLPAPSAGTGSSYEAPRHEKEALLAAVLEEVLKKQPVGVKDDFFVLGGDSIKSMLVVSRLKQQGYQLRIQDILLHPVVEELAGYMKPAAESADQRTVTGIVPLGPVQAFFLNNEDVDKHHFNQSVLLKSNAPVSAEALRKVFDSIILHHDALRMVYYKSAGRWIQENKGEDHSYSFEEITLNDEAAFVAHCERIQAGIDLTHGPLLKVALFTNDRESRLLIVAHHLVIDGVSWRILFKDLADLYTQYTQGAPLTLPGKTHAFRHWQEQQLKYAKSETLQKEEAYWAAVDTIVVPPLPVDHSNGENLVKNVAFTSFLLDEQLTGKLLTACYQAYHTDINDILLTAIGLALAEVFGLNKLAVTLEGHGREDIGGMLDVTRTVGWFTAMYPVVFDLAYRQDPERQLVEIKEQLHRIPNKGIGYGILRYLAGKPYTLEPEITFNYLGDFGNGIQTKEGAALFAFSGDYHGAESSGNRRRGTVLDFSGMVTADTFRLTIAYSKARYEAVTIERLLATCRQQLSDLIHRLSAEKQVHVTPVDLTYKGLTMEQLQALSKKIK